jgi:Ankyrin repeats (3 copies)
MPLLSNAFAAINDNRFAFSAIQWAAQTDNLDMCRWLAACGLDIAVINNNGHSALHKAASKGQSRVCEWLLNEECLSFKHLQPDGDGNTPGVMARLEGHIALADALDASQKLLARAELEGPEIVPPGGPFKVPDSEGCSSDAARQVDECAAAYGAIRKGSTLSEIRSSIRRARSRQLSVQVCAQHVTLDCDSWALS